MTSDTLIPCQRHLFDLPDDVAYLNCAYMSPLMRSVIAAGEAGVRFKARPWEVHVEDFFVNPRRACEMIAAMSGATADDIAIVPAVSYGMATAAANLPVAKGQEIVLIEDQFPSGVYVWREVAREQDARIVTVRAAGNMDLSTAVLDAVGERTAIVVLPHCRWTDGALLDLEGVGARCREVGAGLVLDLTQSLGALPFDVGIVQPDFMVAGSYKWLMGPYTLGFMYVAPRWQDGRPLEHNWIARGGSEDFARLVDYRDDFQPGARRFDMGERSHFHLMPMAVAALTQLMDWGIDNIAATLAARTAAIATRAEKLGLTAPPAHQRAGHYLGLGFPDGLPEGLLDRLAEHNVYVSLRGDSMRVTPHLYNNDADVDRLFAALEAVL